MLNRFQKTVFVLVGTLLVLTALGIAWGTRGEEGSGWTVLFGTLLLAFAIGLLWLVFWVIAAIWHSIRWPHVPAPGGGAGVPAFHGFEEPSHHRTAIEELSEAIFAAAISCTDAMKSHIHEKGTEEKQKSAEVLRAEVLHEFIFFFMHLTNRAIFRNGLGTEKGTRLQGRLFPLVFDRTLESVFGDCCPQDTKDKYRAEFITKLNDAETEYSSCVELVSTAGERTIPELIVKGGARHGLINQLTDRIARLWGDPLCLDITLDQRVKGAVLIGTQSLQLQDLVETAEHFEENIQGPGGIQMNAVQKDSVTYVVSTERVVLPAVGDAILSVVVKSPEMDLENPEVIFLFKPDAYMDEVHEGAVKLVKTYPREQWEEIRAKINPDINLEHDTLASLRAKTALAMRRVTPSSRTTTHRDHGRRIIPWSVVIAVLAFAAFLGCAIGYLTR